MPKTHLRRDEKNTHCGRVISEASLLPEAGEDPRKYAFPNECHWCRVTFDAQHRHQPDTRIHIEILFGMASLEQRPEVFTFETKAEADAFMMGVDTSNGWMQYEVLVDGREDYRAEA